MRFCNHLTAALVLAAFALGASADWQPAKGPLATRWAKDVKPDKVHPEYPRPQLVRDEWQNLNGLWDYAIRPATEGRPDKWDGKILVPFPIESSLSGVMKRVGDDQRLWYRRTFEVPEKWGGRGSQVLLHFGAVDWDAKVWVSGKEVGEHRGGYIPFSLNVTKALKEKGAQELVVSVSDPTDKGRQPRGKQVQKPYGIWYTPTTGIWQTVWLEPVTGVGIEGLKITPDVDKGEVRVAVLNRGAFAEPKNWTVWAKVLIGEKVVAEADAPVGDNLLSLKLPDARPWSPATPFLYDLKVGVAFNGVTRDEVRSYFGMRKISLGDDGKGVQRILLNGKPLFQYGLLDQGFWPDGLYTAPTDEALRYDLEMTKKLGFNMVRKHVKVEPARWYHHCDKLGLLVWQDMPSGDAHVAKGKGEITRTKESAEQFERELTAMMDALDNSPCIVLWVPFNEGWGQYDTKRITELVKKRDPTRLVICASGWNDVPGVGDANDIHVYPGPGIPQPEPGRALVLGEFGGLGLPLRGHTWQDEKNWGYRSYKTKEELTEAYLQLVTNLRPLVGKGLSAAVYTQTTDVEIEVNGLLTYDRAVLKMDADTLAKAHRKLYLPPPTLTEVLPTAKTMWAEWRYTVEKPADGWEAADFDDSKWKKGASGFGTRNTPGTRVRTNWDTKEIWVRRTFRLPEKLPEGLHWYIHHDEDVEVYVNGQRVFQRTGYTTDYILVPLNESALKALKPGENVLAVYCKQTGGGQYIDVGLTSVTEQEGKK